MGEKLNQFIKSYWNYYLELERQLDSTKRYIEFDKHNFNTYSIEYLKLLQATCSEIEVVGKEISSEIGLDYKKANIQKIGYNIQQIFPDLDSKTVRVGDCVLMPWKKFKCEKYTNTNGHVGYKLSDKMKTPKWWTAYNKTKHERTSTFKKDKTNYARANLENIINAMGGLFILEMLFMEHLADGEAFSYEQSKLFELAQ